MAHTPNKPPLVSTLRWGETPMPSTLKPQPRVCVPAALQHKLESSPRCGLGESFIATAEQSDAKKVPMSAPIGTTAALWHLWPCCVPACGATTRKVSGFFDVCCSSTAVLGGQLQQGGRQGCPIPHMLHKESRGNRGAHMFMLLPFTCVCRV